MVTILYLLLILILFCVLGLLCHYADRIKSSKWHIFKVSGAILLLVVFVGGAFGVKAYTRYELKTAKVYKTLEGVSDYEDITEYHGKKLECKGEITTKYRYKDKYYAVIDGSIACVLLGKKDYELCKKGEEVTIRGVCSRGEENILLLQSLVIE